MKRTLFCLISLFVTPGSFVSAQSAGGLEIASITGTLDTIVGDRMKVRSEDGQEYIAIVGRDATVKYRGVADVKFLKPGLLVRFTAPFDVQTGKPQAALTDLEIFRTVYQRRMSKEQQRNQTPGVYPVAAKSEKSKAKQGKSQKAKNGKTKSKKREKVQPKSSTEQNFRVVGQIRAVQGNKMQVSVGNRPIIVQLDPSVTVTVSCGDSMFCMPGDAVEISGLRNAAQANWIQAESVAITGEKPLGAEGTKKSNRRKKSTPAKRSKKR